MLLLREGIIGPIENRRAQRQEGIEALRSPAHAAAFGARANDAFASGLGDATADVHPLSTEDGIAHALGVGGKVIHGPFRDTSGLPWFRWNGRQGCNGRDEVSNLAC